MDPVQETANRGMHADGDDLRGFGLRAALARIGWTATQQKAIGRAGNRFPFSSAPAPPEPAELRATALRLRQHARAHARFFLQAVDRENGGYMEDERDGNFFDRGEKRLMMQARQLFAFSLFAEATPYDPELKAAAEHGFVFLSTRMRDVEFGGFFDAVSTDGTPLDRARPLGQHCFAVLALATFARVFGRPEALSLAQSVQAETDARGYDPDHGGYREGLGPDWTPLPPSRVRERHRSITGTRSFDSELHQTEALIALYRASPDPDLHGRCLEMLLRLLTGFRHPRAGLNLERCPLDDDCEVAGGRSRIAVGHELEHVWLVLDALRALGLPATSVRAWAVQTADTVVAAGWDRRHGGFFRDARFAPPRRLGGLTDKIWWIQAESMVCLLELYALTGRARDFALFRETLDFLERALIRSDGGWWHAVDRSGLEPTRAVAASQMQGAYHSGRALLRCQQLVESLSQTGPGPSRPT